MLHVMRDPGGRPLLGCLARRTPFFYGWAIVALCILVRGGPADSGGQGARQGAAQTLDLTIL